MNGEKKKKLRVLSAEPEKTVLPEVLPDPRRPSAERAPAPRARTLAHLQKLLASAAAVGVGVTSADCTKQQDPPKTTPITPDSNDASSSSSVEQHDAGMMVVASASAVPTASASAVPSATVTAAPTKIAPPVLTPTGYAVVDPMPPPAHCPGIAPLVKPTAKFVDTGGGVFDLVVHFPLPTGRADYKYVKDAQATSYNGKVTKTEVKADGVHATVRLDGTSGQSVTVSVKGTCNKGPGTLSASASWKGAPTASTTTSISVYEY